MNAQRADASAGPAEATSSRPLCTRSAERTSQSASTTTPTTTPARESVSMSASVATYTSRAPRHANSPSMLALRAEPETEHDRDVGEERERVPVIDRLVEPRDALVLRRVRARPS